MKRSLFDSEYERIRRESGLARKQPEFPEDDERAPQAPISSERVAAALDDFHERMGARTAHETEEAERRKAEYDQNAARWNGRLRLQEYQRAGVTPPTVDFDGWPTVSLPMLLRLGWSIERVGGEAVLARPASRPAPAPRKTREEWAAEQQNQEGT
jgi:hypothetical protein